MTKAMMAQRMPEYLRYMQSQELSPATTSKYERDILAFLKTICDDRSITKEDMIAYKQQLLLVQKVSTVNSYLVSVNRYFVWLGHADITVKTMRMPRTDHLENIVSMQEYQTLLVCCLRCKKERDYLLLRTLAGTGIRSGEVQFITRQAVESGYTALYNKGRTRVILLTDELQGLLLQFCEQQQIVQGPVFRGRVPEQALQPKSIWRLLKRVAIRAGIAAAKVYPHSLRHLFAKTYMQQNGNMMDLADLLGHASLETTRLYTRASTTEKRFALNALGL